MQEKSKPKNLSFLKHIETLPSSPPWPSSSTGAGNDTSMLEQCSDNRFDSRHAESFSRECKVDKADTHNEDSIHPSSENNHYQLDAGFTSEHGDRVSALGSIRPLRHSKQVPSLTLLKRSRQSSAYSQSQESLSDSFSAVYISKHNTTDGGIAYAPIDMSRSELAERLAQLGMSHTSQSVSRRSPSAESSPDRQVSKVDLSFSGVQSDLPDNLPGGTPSLVSIGEFVTHSSLE